MASVEFTEDRPFRRRILLIGFAILGAFLLLLGTWSKIVPIESAIVAAGIVSAESSTRTVQHLEGGIVQDILVRPGDEVVPNQVLVRLQNTSPLARLNEIQAQHFEAVAEKARLTAEQNGDAAIQFPDYLADKLGDLAAQSAMQSQIKLFESRRQLLDERIGIHERTRAGLANQIGGLRGQIDSSELMMAIVQDELVRARDLVERRLGSRDAQVALEIELAELMGAVAEDAAAIGVAEQSLAESELRASELRTEYATEIADDLSAVNIRLHELTQQLVRAQDIVRRTEIRSPIAGIVVDMAVGTQGGVLSAGETLMSIVPTSDELVVEARVDPLDIDLVSEGLPTTVWLTALNRRTHTGIDGVVRTLSADRLTDTRTGAPYYLARVEMSKSDVERSSIPLQPGMGAEVMIRTGAQTTFDYISAPIARAISRSMREN